MDVARDEHPFQVPRIRVVTAMRHRQVEIDLPGSGLTSPLSNDAEVTHVRQLYGLYTLAKSMGFWTGPVAFPEWASTLL